MANPFEMGKYRHPGLLLHQADQPLAAARHDDVDLFLQTGQHQADCFTVRGRHNLRRIRVKACRLQGAGETGMNQTGRVLDLRTAAQNHRIASFQA